MTAIEIQGQLRQLHAERDLAVTAGPDTRYLADLQDEIAATHVAYVATAVTEIATLRAELFGAQLG